jgi:D-alanyl-D-alanine dipeptidase
MLQRAWRRIHYEINQRCRDRTRYADDIEQAQSSAKKYCAALGLDNLLAQSTSTGADLSDYALLHRYVLAHKPSLVIEFGSGRSSIVLGHALKQVGGCLITYEAIPEFHRNLVEIIPSELKQTISAIYSPRQVREFEGIWGVRYEAAPPAGASFFFVDGPTETVDGRKGACLDILFYMARYPTQRISAIIDKKFSSQEAYESVLPRGSVRYDPVLDVGVMRDVRGQMLCKPRTSWWIRSGSAPHLLGL